MKIYNVLKVPQGLGYDEVDYDALYQSGYTAGHQSGYTDGLNACFSVYPTEIEDNEGTGGTYTIEIVTGDIWTASWDGMIPGSNWCTFSPSSGEGSGQITLTLQPYENPEGYYELPRVGDLTVTNSKGESAVVQVGQRPQAAFVITPSELVYEYSGGGKDAQITTPASWYIDDSDFEWEYNVWSPMYGETTWTGFSADSLNRIEVSEEAGVGDKTITVSTPDTGDIQKVYVATYVPGYQGGYAAQVTERSGKLKASAGITEKDITLTQHIGSGWNVKSTGGTVQLYLDAADPGFKEYHLGLRYHFLSPYPDPWGNYPLHYSGSVSELPKVIDLFVPPYTEGLDPYWYGEDGEINVYYGLQFEPEERDPSVYIDDARLYLHIPQTDVRLNVTHNFPEPEYSTINVPETGATYTMTISGNSNWSANTVSFTQGVLCTLSQSSGAANESTTVTVTFANDGTSKSGLIEILTQADRTVQGVNYFVFQFSQGTPEPPAA